MSSNKKKLKYLPKELKLINKIPTYRSYSSHHHQVGTTWLCYKNSSLKHCKYLLGDMIKTFNYVSASKFRKQFATISQAEIQKSSSAFFINTSNTSDSSKVEGRQRQIKFTYSIGYQSALRGKKKKRRPRRGAMATRRFRRSHPQN